MLLRYKYTQPLTLLATESQLNNQQSSIFKMDENRGKDGYIEVSIRPIPEQLDLSGQQSFSLQLHVTLRHAPKPILVYKQDTIFELSTALHEGGIEFYPCGDVNNQDSKPVGRGTIHICVFGGASRPYDRGYLLFLEPDTPRVIDLPFSDLEFNAEGLKTGEMYAAFVPAGHKATWWRWATLDEVQTGTPRECREPYAIIKVLLNLRKWWTRNCDVENVPILPEEKRLPIRQAAEMGATFFCVGR